MIANRRRFLQILAAAPFAPWKEIVEELAKPAVTYFIPPRMVEVSLPRDERGIWPGMQIWAPTHNYQLGDTIALTGTDNKHRGTFRISYVDSIAGMLYLERPEPKIAARLIS